MCAPFWPVPSTARTAGNAQLLLRDASGEVQNLQGDKSINSMQNIEGMGVLGCFVEHESLWSKKRAMTKKHTFFKVQPCVQAEGSALYLCALENALLDIVQPSDPLRH